MVQLFESNIRERIHEAFLAYLQGIDNGIPK